MERSKDSISDRINCNSSTNPKVTLYRYSPENIPYEVLKSIFVGRDDLFEKTFKELETAGKNKTPRFYLVVGSRGIGKSHFLIMLYHKIKQDLSSLYIPVKFAEEEYSVYRASDFFLRILQETSEDISDILSLNNEDEILDASLGKLKEIVKKESKIYLIFVENLHEVFRQLEPKEVQKLRSIFQKHDFFSVVASSPIIFPGIASHEEPFYNFFRIQHLRELSSSEIKILLKKIAEIECNKEFLENFEKYESRMEGMTHLTGGTPRLVIFFYELISRDNFEDIEKVFFKILDEHTPYYQEIFQLLTGQKRLIFDTVISSESPMTPKQIAEKSRIDASTVITQLRRLEKDGYVLSRPAGRETYYEVRERLFRLWRELRQPLGRNRISIFVNFLKLWYTSEELKEHFERKFHLLESGSKDVLKDLCYRVEALSGKYKIEALLKLTPKIIEFEEWEEADHDIQKLKEIANKNMDIDLKAKSLIFESLSNYKHDKVSLEIFKMALKFNTKDYYVLLDSGHITIYNEMLKALDNVLALNPYDDYALSRKGYSLKSLGRYEEALEIFNRVLVLNPDDKYTLSNKGYALDSLGRYEEALEVFNKFLVLSPDDKCALSSKGYALKSLERYEEALEVFNKVLVQNPYDDYALSGKGNALKSLERYEEALEVLNKVLVLNPDNEHALSNKGYVLGSLKMHEEALEVFNNVLVLNPDDMSALSNKGNALNSLERYEEALEVFNKVLVLNPDNMYALLRKGYALGSLDRYEEALEVFNKFLVLNPDDEYALSGKGNTLNSLERYEEALEVLNKVLVLNPDDEYALLRKGYALKSLERYEEALEVFNKVLVLNPDDEYALLRKGYALNSLERYEEALEVFDKVLVQNPDDEYALSGKGNTLNSLERYEEALEVFNKLLVLNPDDEYALLRKGYALGSLERYEEALEVFNKVLVQNPDDEYALSGKGNALNSLERYEEALKVFDKVLVLNPNDEYALLRKGYALNSLERYEEALEVFNKLLVLNPDDEYALSGEGYALSSLERYEDAIEMFVKVKNITSNESLKIESILDLIEAYLSLNQVAGANTEIELIKSKIFDQTPSLIEKFIEAGWKIVFEELKIRNLGSVRKLIRTIFDLEPQLKKETFEALMMDFFKMAVDSGEFEVLKIVIDEIMKIKGGKFPELLKPLIKAVEIVETKDIQKYYKLQVEEREIVADIVQKISKSGDLLP